MIALFLALMQLTAPVNPAGDDVDDPKIQRMMDTLPGAKNFQAPTQARYPSLQVGYAYGGSFGLEEPQGEHTVSVYTWPWQHHWRFGLGLEAGFLSRDSGGHVGLSFTLGRQGRLPLHWYADCSIMGGVYRINLYQAEVIAPITKVGLHGGFGFSVGKAHLTMGLVLERTDLFLSGGGVSGISVGVEFRIGL
ncbi:hypothetical protein KKF84_07290 [Myxococcota bacterium]|nr:hypothetical protein [Myxococcota bacterium]MBU1535107.1 hypothetical protein [Myxococcota bacterium]